MENDTQPEKASKAYAIKGAILVMCVVGAGTVMALTGNGSKQCNCLRPSTDPTSQTTRPGGVDAEQGAHGIAHPRLLDLGAGKCIPCKKMTPILADLKKEYEGRLDVVFIDVWQNPDAADQYGVQSIPTQIFFDAAGKELYRHQGFFAKEEILKKWDELGVDLKN